CRQLVYQAAQRYGVQPALILAIMETESSFNPFAVSPAGAVGVMQVMGATAGRGGFERLYRRAGQPDRNFHVDPVRNIDIRTAYLTILRDTYLRDVRAPLAREYCIIAAYNGGTGNLLKAFHKDRKKAVERINKLSAAEVYR